MRVVHRADVSLGQLCEGRKIIRYERQVPFWDNFCDRVVEGLAVSSLTPAAKQDGQQRFLKGTDVVADHMPARRSTDRAKAVTSWWASTTCVGSCYLDSFFIWPISPTKLITLR